MTGLSPEQITSLERHLEIEDGGALSFLLEEESLRDSLPDGKAYYEHIISSVELDRSNPKNSYIMYIAGKVDRIDMSKPCLFTKASTALPDIDVDFPTDYREKAIDYVRTKYGPDKVCQITTFGRLSGRSAVKAVMRVEGGYDFETMNLVTEGIPDEAAISDQLEETGEDSILSWMLHNDGDKIADYCRLEDGILVGDYADIFRKAIALEGTFQNQGKHAAGVIISSEEVAKVSPMCLAKDGSAIAAFDMAWLEKAGLVKFDFLGVDILNKIQEAWGPDIVNVPFTDEEAWDVICGGNTKGCFQIENHLGRDWSKEIRPRNIEELSAVISVIRPGSLMARDESGRSMTKVYADRKNGLEPVEDNPINRVIDTYGVLVYQETLQIIAKILAGFNCADGIKLMKSVGKKDAKLLFSLEDKFLSGCLKTGTIPKDDAVKLFTNIKSSARYLFNKSISSESVTKCRDGSTKTIAQIQAGDEVMTPTGFAKVIAKYDHGVMNTYSATFSNGSNVRCSINHKFLCENGDILPLGQILYEGRRVIAESETVEIIYLDYVGKENLWDIEIDSEDHIYFANGVATSNSHGVSYSYPCYWSAYIKAHKPLKFYEVWLKYSSHKLDPHAEVRNLVLSAKLDNIEILPPSCEYLTEGFFIKGEAVVFGLSHIKGVANRELEKLFALIRTHGVRASLVTYLTEILPHINKRTCEALINCGCFHYLGVSRAALLHYYECFSDLSDKELVFFQDKSFKTPAEALEAACLLKKEGGACATKVRVEKLKIILERLTNPGRILHDLPGKIAASEEAAIGTTLSCSYMDACLAAGVADTTCKEIMRGKPGKRTIVVRITEVKEHVIKSSDKKMAFLTVCDDSAEIDNVVCFADQYEQFGRFMYDGAMVAIYGELGKKRSFVIDRVVEL
jgi:DNA polymerase III alpha subunit